MGAAAPNPRRFVNLARILELVALVWLVGWLVVATPLFLDRYGEPVHGLTAMGFQLQFAFSASVAFWVSAGRLRVVAGDLLAGSSPWRFDMWTFKILLAVGIGLILFEFTVLAYVGFAV